MEKLVYNLTHIASFNNDNEGLKAKINSFTQRYPLYLLVFYPYCKDFEMLFQYDDCIHNTILTHMLEMENVITTLENNQKFIGLPLFCDIQHSHKKFSLFQLEEFLKFVENEVTNSVDDTVNVYL